MAEAKDLRELATTIGERSKARARSLFHASMFIKIALVALSTVVAGIAQTMAAVGAGTLTGWQVAGIGATVVTGIGAIFVLFTERDASNDLDAARNAIEQARSAEANIDELLAQFDDYEAQVQRAIELYAAMTAMRGVIEQTLASPLRDPVKIIETVMTAAKRSLPIAMGFQQSDRWTICVYFGERDEREARNLIRCVAHIRAIECQIAEARTWPEGVGVGGVAFANGREVIVPDLTDEAMGTVFDLGDRKKGYDDERYKSLAAVPVSVDRSQSPGAS